MKYFLFFISFANLLFSENIWLLEDFNGKTFGPYGNDGEHIIVDDKIKSKIFVQYETIDGEGKWFVKSDDWKSTVIAVEGESSFSFIESYGGNNAIYTICLDYKNEDGTFLVLYCANKTDGFVGARSNMLKGKAKLLIKQNK